MKTQMEREIELLKLAGLTGDQIDVLGGNGYFTAPASIKYHDNTIGGLAIHSATVTELLVTYSRRLRLEWEKQRSPYLVGMLHDLCKCDQYIISPDGKLEHNPNTLLSGHGDKSCILAAVIKPDLTAEEILCIRWHMGAFDDSENWNCYTNAVRQCPNVLYTHMADMAAAYIRS